MTAYETFQPPSPLSGMRYPSPFPEMIRRLREQYGLTQKRSAQLTLMSRERRKRLERGKGRMRPAEREWFRLVVCGRAVRSRHGLISRHRT